MPDRENIIRRLERMKEDAYVSAVFRDVIDDALAMLKEQEEKLAMMRMIYGTDAKVVGEVVRCKDCKHSHCTYDGMTKFCDLIKDENDMMIELYRPGDWYCADGERCEGH